MEKVTVTSARTASPRMRPVSVSTPEGMSAQTTGAGERFISRTALAAGSRSALFSPTPNSASTSTSAFMANTAWPLTWGSYSSSVPPAAFRRRSISRLSGVIFSRFPTRKQRTRQPARSSSQATAIPSPPLFPGPENTATAGSLPRWFLT